MPFVQSQVRADATARLLANVDALSGVFSFLAVNTAACFACEDFFSAWYHITGTPEILQAYGRLQEMFRVWYNKEIKWFYKKKCPKFEREKICDLVFNKFLASHALAKALRCTLRFIGVQRRLNQRSWKKYRSHYAQEHYSYGFIERLKEYLPAVLQDFGESYSPRAEYAHSSHAHTLSFLACWYLPYSRLSWTTTCELHNMRTLEERPFEIQSNGWHAIYEWAEHDPIWNHLRNAMKLGPPSLGFFKFALATFPDAFTKDEEFLTIVKSFVQNKMASIRSAEMVLRFYKRLHGMSVSPHYDDPVCSIGRIAFLEDALPVLDKCLGGSEKLAKKGAIWLKEYQKCFPEHWEPVSREVGLKNILATLD